jgi:hypothetical protein
MGPRLHKANGVKSPTKDLHWLSNLDLRLGFGDKERSQQKTSSNRMKDVDMRLVLVWLLTCCVAAACAPAPINAAANREVAGRWRVTHLDGHPIEGSIFDFLATGVVALGPCGNRMTVALVVKGRRLVRSGSAVEQEQTLVGCDGPHASDRQRQEATLFGVLSESVDAALQGEQTLELRAPGGQTARLIRTQSGE